MVHPGNRTSFNTKMRSSLATQWVKVAAVAHVQCLAQELPHAMGMGKKKKKKKKKNKKKKKKKKKKKNQKKKTPKTKK